MIIADIDVTKLDKERFRPGKDGKPKYCDLVFIDCPKGKSDGFVKQGVSKEEREARVEMPIIGNWRLVGGEKPAARQPSNRPAAPRPEPNLDRSEDDIPF